MALQCICRQTWKKQQAEMSPGVPMPGRSMDQGTTHRHSHMGMSLSQRWSPSSQGLNALGSASRCRRGSRPHPRHPQGRERQQAGVQAAATTIQGPGGCGFCTSACPNLGQLLVGTAPMAEGHPAGQALGAAGSPSACTSLSLALVTPFTL